MKPYKLFEERADLPEVVKLILNQDIAALDRCINVTWRLNEPISVSLYMDELPLTIALVENRLEVVDYLLRKKVNLNVRGDPAMVNAARNCSADTLRKLAAARAKIHLTNHVGTNAISAALYSERYDLLPVLLELGLSADSDGGVSLRQAVYDRQMEAVQFFIEHGHDPNLRCADQVFPNNPTAVAVAAENDDMEMVRYLVEHGADVKLADKHGERPYTAAVSNGNVEMQAYLRAHEPPEWHDAGQRAAVLQSYNVPAALIAFLSQDERRIDMPGEEPAFIEFHHITNAPEASWKRGFKRWQFVDLLSRVDNYGQQGFLVWLKKEKMLASIDYEHEEIRVLCDWEQFTAEPARWIARIFE